jgi:hypothetical protein
MHQNGTNLAPVTINSTANASILHTWVIREQSPIFFGENGDFPKWGNLTYTTMAYGMDGGFTYQAGFRIDLMSQFVENKKLTNNVDADFRGWNVREPIFAFAHHAGCNVSQAEVRYTIGSVQNPVIKYLSSAGVVPLKPWWERCYGDMFDMLEFHWDDLDAVRELGNEFESQLQQDVGAYYENNGDMTGTNNTSSLIPSNAANTTDESRADNFTDGAVSDDFEAQNYYSILALSAQQVMHAYAYAVPPPPSSCASATNTQTIEPLMFPKEISSDGNVNTIDVLYPAMPFFLWANPEMVRYTLQPLLENQEAGFYPNGYSMHDLGSSFPNATGHVEGNDEAMPIEESGNFILMAYAYYRFSGNSRWLTKHYGLLKQFANFLTQYSLVPFGQLSTDDFAGTLVNQTNLAIKGIVGLAAMGRVADIVAVADGNTTITQESAAFQSTAREYFDQWKRYGIDPSGHHTLLAYQWRSSWGLLYNTYPDKLLNLGIVDASVYQMQSDFYPTVSQTFGIPLDSRHAYTKSDWMMWTAATCADVCTCHKALVCELAGPLAQQYQY